MRRKLEKQVSGTYILRVDDTKCDDNLCTRGLRLGNKALHLQEMMDDYKAWCEKQMPPKHFSPLCLIGIHKTARVLIDDKDFDTFCFDRTYCLRCGKWGWAKNRTPDKKLTLQEQP
jgi:hypothetical protein